MIWLLLLFTAICLTNVKFNFKTIFKDYLGKSQTNAIRGIFAILIFFSHFTTYVSLESNFGDNIYLKIISSIGQLMVAPFLFYSGYGIYCSAKKKPNYIKTFPKHRFLKTLVFFDLAVIPYLIIALVRGSSYNIWHILLSFTGWTSLGNSNWFMFAILMLYIFIYLSALFTKRKINLKTILITTMFTIGYIFLVNYFKQGATYWTDTVLCFSGGMLVAHFKDKIDSLLKRKAILCTLFCIVICATLFFIKTKTAGLPYIFIYNVLSIFFCLTVSVLTSRIQINNRILQFLGTYGFEIYILQRIPDILLQPILGQYTVPFFFASLIVTLVISIIFKRLTAILIEKPHKNHLLSRL
ncbi:acyltransferase [Candidatus Saccharibacteria bacterium]|nr:acyltransferase [Candidatus Saccharibacteria bacterium]